MTNKPGDIKDVIHFYLGCEVSHNSFDNYFGILYSLEVNPDNGYMIKYGNDFMEQYINDFKPRLRPLSSMTEEEQMEWNHRKQRKGYMYQVHADNTLWLIQKGFDVFNLIPNQAIDKTKL